MDLTTPDEMPSVPTARSRRLTGPRYLAMVAACLAAATCSESTPPAVPTTIVVSPTALAFDAIGATATVTASVSDQDGNPMPNEPVSWSSSSGAVTITAVASAGSSPLPGAAVASQTGGSTTAPAVTITAAAGGNAIVTATARTISATVSAVVEQIPTTLIKFGGDQQTGTVGAVLPEALRVRVQDRLGAPIAGRLVTFTVAQGAGSVSPASAVTGADGSASTQWTLGTNAQVQHSVTVSVAGSPSTAVFVATPRAGPAAALTINDGDGQTAIVGTAVAIAPSVRVTDAFGNPVQGASVTFVVTGGGGSVGAATAVSTATGVAAVQGWTLGTTPGTNTLTASVAGVAPVSFTATGVAGPPAQLIVQAGDGQSAPAGTAVPIPPSVRVIDQFGNSVSGVPVTYAVTGGGGTITGAQATTGADGVAAVGSWTLGAVAGQNTLSATAGAAGVAGNPAVFTATGTAGGGGGSGGGGAGGFNITLRFLSTITAPQMAAFTSAAAKWSSVITGDLPDVPAVIQAGSCGTNSPAINETIDDLLIFATILPIDGPGGVLGLAGPCFVRTSGSLPVIGLMVFDLADVATLEASGELAAVILHEMGHVLGIGSLWGAFGLLQNPSFPGGPPLDTFFSGVNGIAAFNAIGGSTYTGGQKVPVEHLGGEGTINSHWRKSVLQNELMTGSLTSGVPTPLSQLTARSLQDFGYTVNAAAADPFFLTLGLRAGIDVETIELVNDVYVGPLYAIDPQGRITRIR